MKLFLNLLLINIILHNLCFATTDLADPKQPIKITANNVEFDDKLGTAIYTGNVIAQQGSRHLTAAKLTLYRNNQNKIALIIATGTPAHFQAQPNLNKPINSGIANTIKYFPQEDKADLIGNATITQEGNSISGPWLIYFFKSGLLKTNFTGKQRTTVILQPNSGTQ